MPYSLPVVRVAAFVPLCAGGRAAAGDGMGEAASVTSPGRSVTFTGVGCICRSGDRCWEGHCSVMGFSLVY